MTADWESLEAHRAFMDSEIYGPFGKRLEALLSDPPHLYHVHFKTPFNKPASAPVTEMVALYFAPDYKPSDFDPDFGKFTAVLEKSAEGYRGSAGGWVVEELEYDGQKGKAFVAAIGWDSIDAHKAYRETEAFSNSIGALRAATRGIDLVSTCLSTSPSASCDDGVWAVLERKLTAAGSFMPCTRRT